MNRLIKLVALLVFGCASVANAADLSITAANVKILQTTTRVLNVKFGETVTAGMPVYKNADTKYYKADNDDTSTKATVAGIVYVGGATDAWGTIVTSGEMDLGATLTVGQHYVVSSTLGGVCPNADLGTSDYISSLGFAVTTGKFIVNIKNSGYQVP